MFSLSTSTKLSPHSRRGLVRILAGGLAALTHPAADAGAAKRKRRKKRKFRTVTKTFSNPAPITIVDDASAGPYPSTTLVTGFKRGKLLDVNLTLRRLSHGFPSDVDLALQAPNGRRAIVMSDVGNSVDVTDITLILDDQAAARLPFQARLGPGRFRPTNHDFGERDVFPTPGGNSKHVALDTFSGINPNGAWRLFIVDDLSGSQGEIGAGWSLTIRARVRK